MELDVEYHGEAVGNLYQHSSGAIFFDYAASWRSGRRELSPFHLPNSTPGAASTFKSLFGELHGLFQDALPDWWGQQMMRRSFFEAGIPWNRVTALQKLACQGDRKMGALVFKPVLNDKSFSDTLLVELSDLVEAARHALKGETTEVLAELVRSGMSPGGARPKSLLWLSDEGRTLHLEEGPNREPWLLKFDLDADTQEGRIEQAYTRMAAAAGIAVPESRLIEAAGGCHFLVRRFDRDAAGERIHFHSYSGLTHTPVRDGLDYEDLMNVARELTGDQRAVEEVFRRAVFNVAAGNDDDHARNHGFLMDDEGTWRLSPAFDLTLATNPLTSGSRSGRIQARSLGITRRHLVLLGESQGVRRIRDAIDGVLDAVSHWPDFASAVGLPKGHTAFVQSQLQALHD
jgi:serine/threonine-protein kinase HipA